MATKEEVIGSENELLHEKPNKFEWSNYKEHTHKQLRDRIMADPYDCDWCCDTYNINDLYKIQAERVCKNCLCSG